MEITEYFYQKTAVYGTVIFQEQNLADSPLFSAV